MARLAARITRLLLVGAVLAGVAITMTPATPAAAATGGCYGASCAGLDPMGRCDGDARTVASYALTTDRGYAGNIDLRWSNSCHANWGRFTAAYGWREMVAQSLHQPIPIYGRVTAWNPGGPSQDAVNSPLSPIPGFSSWTKMVDGNKTACTGVEVVYGDVTSSGGGSFESKGWFWGPCV